MINEGGNIGKSNSAVPKEYLKINAETAIDIVGFNNLNYDLVGNINKPVLGDIDIAFDSKEIVDTVDGISEETFWKDIELLLKNNNKIDDYKISKGFNQFSIVVPLINNQGNHLPAYDKYGNKLRDRGYIQIDFFLGDLNWMKGALSPPGDDSKYKAVYRNILLAEMLRFIIFKTKDPDIKRKLQINWKLGVELVDFKIDEKGKRKKIKINKIIGNMDKLSKFLFNSKYTFQDINTFEKLYNAFERNFRFKKYTNEIKDGFKETLNRLKLPIPQEINEGATTMSIKINELDTILRESDEIIKMLSEDSSVASRKAKKMGLVHKGFGTYGPEDGPVMYKTVNGKLSKVKNVKKDDEHSKKKGITDIHRISGENNLFSYRYNGKKRRIQLSKDEMESYVNKSLSLKQIIKARLDSIAKKKKGKDHKAISNNEK